jgi:hypothetical protein
MKQLRMDIDAPVPLLVSRDIAERVSSDSEFADLFFSAENRNVRQLYRRTGDPRLSLQLGESVTRFAESLSVVGSVALGVLCLFLAEMSIAVSSRGVDLRRVAVHLNMARVQFEESKRSSIAARGMINWYWISAISAKAQGNYGDYSALLGQPLRESWIRGHADPTDFVPVIRQRAMMTQDLSQHLLLLGDAELYKSDRPLEYYRTIKRVVEFLTNKGLVTSASILENELIAAFSSISSDATLISRISFLKNLAHLRALLGNLESARRIIDVARRDAGAAGLHGQVRQLTALKAAVDEADVRGALLTFRV